MEYFEYDVPTGYTALSTKGLKFYNGFIQQLINLHYIFNTKLL